MREPTIRTYLPEDYEEVRALLDDHQYRVPHDPEELCGVAFVAHEPQDDDGLPENPRMVGFVWALAAGDCSVAFVDHFVVDREYRTSRVGIQMLLVLRKILEQQGIKKIIGVTPPGNTGTLRLLRKRGIEVVPNHALMVMRTAVEEVA